MALTLEEGLGVFLLHLFFKKENEFGHTHHLPEVGKESR